MCKHDYHAQGLRGPKLSNFKISITAGWMKPLILTLTFCNNKQAFLATRNTPILNPSK
jgi:hypothetical protein